MTDLPGRFSKIEDAAGLTFASFHNLIEQMLAHWRRAQAIHLVMPPECQEAARNTSTDPWEAITRTVPVLASVHPDVHTYFIDMLERCEHAMGALRSFASERTAEGDIDARLEALESVMLACAHLLERSVSSGGGVGVWPVGGSSGGG